MKNPTKLLIFITFTLLILGLLILVVANDIHAGMDFGNKSSSSAKIENARYMIGKLIDFTDKFTTYEDQLNKWHYLNEEFKRLVDGGNSKEDKWMEDKIQQKAHIVLLALKKGRKDLAEKELIQLTDNWQKRAVGAGLRSYSKPIKEGE